MASLFGCNSGSFPFTYLGLPVGGRMNKLESWNPVLEKFTKRLSDWKARSVSFGGRLTLVKSMLNSLPLYYFSLFRAPPCVVKKLESVRRKCLDDLGISFRNSFLGKIGDGLSTSFWNDLWAGDVILKNRFKRLAHLESNLDASVGSRVLQDGSGQRFNGGWIREPTGRAKGELEDLHRLLSSVTLHPKKADSWCWSMCSTGSFKTKVLSELIDSKLLHASSSSSSGTIRNSLVPKKVEVFVWRILKGRIPVLVELDKRGVDLHSVRCPNCNDDIESISHSFLFCEKVRNVWDNIFDWWDVPRPSSLNLRALLDGNSVHFGSEVARSIWQAVIWSSVYLMWKNRNEKVFKNKSWNVPVAVCEIQVKSFEWVARRCKEKDIDWNSWLHNPYSLAS
ncbi:uncharacterized protein [Rutidosis leptorrhynchoides]|uniref:uncharacterized protein n=1 Tax=Rutidosis leptorrhynchoides TaxID=125765 RepID=UPI003A9A0C1F